MEKFIPLNKQSKKAQKAYYAKQRKTWQGLDPVTKRVESKKTYNRAKQKALIQKSDECFLNWLDNVTALF